MTGPAFSWSANKVVRAASDREEGIAQGSTPGIGKRVLIVEDAALVAMEFEGALLDEGFEVVGNAMSADGAVALAEKLKPDFVLMDNRLVGSRDGISAAIEIYNRFAIRSVFVTANDDADSRERATPALPLAWLRKPISGAALVESLKTLGTR